MIHGSIGNKRILKLPKTAFLCSRQVPSPVILKCYDWAIEQRDAGNCIISGFHNVIEKDVLHYLLKGNQPIIIALARGLKKKIEKEFQKPLENGRLLIITPFEEDVKKVTLKTSMIRNQLMIELAKTVVIGWAKKGGRIDELIKETCKKKVVFLNKD
jgi:predicted Rossmann fold nucleotide-binding protein DprA/Smf involved in DNA uptake